MKDITDYNCENIVLVNNITEIGIVIVRCKTYTGSDYPFDIFKLF
jgi:hypothetical protein